jgi:hypothetical protein
MNHLLQRTLASLVILLATLLMTAQAHAFEDNWHVLAVDVTAFFDKNLL